MIFPPRDSITGQSEMEADGKKSDAGARAAAAAPVEFLPAEHFNVSKAGYVFKNGCRGLGYYFDRGPFQAALVVEAARQSKEVRRSVARLRRLATAAPSSTASLTLVQVLESFPPEILWRILMSAHRTIALRNTCKTVKRAFETLQPPVRVKYRSRTFKCDGLALKLTALMPWCRIASLEAHEWRPQWDYPTPEQPYANWPGWGKGVCPYSIANRTIGGLVPILGQCTSLERLTICKGTLAADSAGKLVASLSFPAGLVHLNLSRNVIKAKNLEQLALVIAQCTALTHLDLGFNQIGDEVGAVAEVCN